MDGAAYNQLRSHSTGIRETEVVALCEQGDSRNEVYQWRSLTLENTEMKNLTVWDMLA